MNPYQNLANAVVLQAVDDYRRALRDKPCYGHYGSSEEMIRDCEKFFNSNYFQLLTKCDGEYLIYKLKEEYKNESKSRAGNKRPPRNDF